MKIYRMLFNILSIMELCSFSNISKSTTTIINKKTENEFWNHESINKYYKLCKNNENIRPYSMPMLNRILTDNMH